MFALKTSVGLLITIGLTASLVVMVSHTPREVRLHFTPLDEYSKINLNTNLLPKNDYNTNINIDFRFKNIHMVCKNKTSSPLLLILVHSSSKNFLKRKLIRETWGRTSERVKIAFLIGQPPTEETDRKLKEEISDNEDIVQGDFLDTYHNITYKHTMGLKYLVYHCPTAKYVLKIDDDMFVNTPHLERFLTDQISPLGAKDMLMCTTVANARTLRSYRSKWRISFEEYPYRYFPTFCRGMAILYSPDIVFNLYRKAQVNRKYIRLDDVFYTGLTAASIGFTGHSNIEALMSFVYKQDSGDAYIPKNLDSYLFVGSELGERDILKLWKQLEKYYNDSIIINS